MNDNDEQKSDGNTNENRFTLDDVVTTQPELGPSTPDGGFGWFVFIGTLFFQAVVPCLILNFGIFLAFSKLENETASDKNTRLWEDPILHVPLFFSFARIFFDPFARRLVTRTTSPRLVTVVGTCLTCAGLLFVWMGMTGNRDYWLFSPAGIFSGLGSSILLVQCENIVTQYFRLKLPILKQVSQFVGVLGFLVAPIILGHHILTTNISQVILWYQAIILQGLVVGLLFRKPLYLKSQNRKRHQFADLNPDDEEDILSKNSRELQIRRQTSTETQMSRIPLDQPGPSGSHLRQDVSVVVMEEGNRKNTWEKFAEEDVDNNVDPQEDVKYARLNDWEMFDENDRDQNGTITKAIKSGDWERFEDDEAKSPRIVNELSLAEETNHKPAPLFTDFPVNNNITYAYDDEIVEAPSHNVFAPNIKERSFRRQVEVLKEPTFYKSLLVMVTNTFSSFVFFALFPSYLYIEVDSVTIRQMTGLVGALFLINLVFLCASYWVTVDKKRRPICFWFFYWLGSVGYLMIADLTTEYGLVVGGLQIVLSIGALDRFSKPLLEVSMKGKTGQKNVLLAAFSGLPLLLFLCVDTSYKSCFRFMSILHFITGTLWLANWFYRKFIVR